MADRMADRMADPAARRPSPFRRLARLGLIALWLVVPLALGAWHAGSGAQHLAEESAARAATQARQLAEAGQWSEAADAADAAVASLARARALEAESGVVRTSDPQLDRVLLAQCAARWRAGDLAEGLDQAITLLSDLEQRAAADPELVRATRSEVASASYVAAWFMRLEGGEDQEWAIAAEESRAQFRLLAETAVPGSGEAEAAAKNLEAAIRLQRLDLGELRALPLPKVGNCSCQCTSKKLCQQCRGKREGRCRGKGTCESKKKGDAREQCRSNGAGLYSPEGGEAW